jgi:hypothetical protein
MNTAGELGTVQLISLWQTSSMARIVVYAYRNRTSWVAPTDKPCPQPTNSTTLPVDQRADSAILFGSTPLSQ